MGQGRRWAAGFALVLSSFAVLGYHPYAEDGGLYLAELKHSLDPGLYPQATQFVTGHLGIATFGFLVASLTRITHLHLDVVLLLLQLLSIAGVLLGIALLARRCYAEPQAQAGAVGLVALAMGMPVAGTSLMLMDPYVTARSVVTALVVLALACLVSNRQIRAALIFLLALVIHPLMGGLGAASALVLLCFLDRRRSVRSAGIIAIFLLAVLAACIAQSVAPAESRDYERIVATRYYWFLAEWHWYEWLGLAAPGAILAWIAYRGKGTERDLARMSVALGGGAVLLAALFAREAARVHAVARVQPLRCFQVVYLVLLLVLGARLGVAVLRRSVLRWTLAAAALAGGMFVVQRQTYPASDHLELPGQPPRNQWEQAFVWIRQQTPEDALFALDADYVHRSGEDVQIFRALAERSALPDYSKDGGQASIRPELTGLWIAGQQVQARLSEETDAERLAAVQGTAVSWVVLSREAVTSFSCPYTNQAVRVCRVPAQSDASDHRERYNRP